MLSSLTKLVSEILNDTLKRNGKFSSTLVTMFVFSAACLLYGFNDFFKNGFNSEVWFSFIAISGGVKITDAFSKKLKPTIE